MHMRKFILGAAAAAFLALGVAPCPAQTVNPAVPDRSSRVVAANNTTGVNVLNGKGMLTGYALFNTSAAKTFVKLYDKATAPTVGTDTPFLTIGIPAGARVDVTGLKKRLDAGLGWGITTAITDADTTAPAANDVTGMLTYQAN